MPIVVHQPVRSSSIALSAVTLGALALLAAGATPARAQEAAPNPLDSLTWQAGPGTANIGALAEIDLPAGYRFLGGPDTRRFLEALENPTSGDELGLIVPEAEGQHWFVVFEFSDIGYVKDDEKDKLDADAMLESIRAGNERSNEERRKRGWGTLKIVGWERAPSYDPATNNLEWAIRGQAEDSASVNFNTRILGRDGVMEVNLVIDPEGLAAALPTFKTLLGGYRFKDGHRYAEFRSGDKIAKYGLAALVTGGAAAVALKTGLLQKFWKFIVAGLIGVGALIKRIAFGRRSETLTDR